MSKEVKRRTPSIDPRGLSRIEAAYYIGVCPTTFDKLVADGRMPKPKRIGARTIWDREALDLAFWALDMEPTEQLNDWN